MESTSRRSIVFQLKTVRYVIEGYSSVVTLSREDVIKIKSRLLQVIDEHLELISASKEEVGFAYNIDFFEI